MEGGYRIGPLLFRRHTVLGQKLQCWAFDHKASLQFTHHAVSSLCPPVRHKSGMVSSPVQTRTLPLPPALWSTSHSLGESPSIHPCIHPCHFPLLPGRRYQCSSDGCRLAFRSMKELLDHMWVHYRPTQSMEGKFGGLGVKVACRERRNWGSQPASQLWKPGFSRESFGWRPAYSPSELGPSELGPSPCLLEMTLVSPRKNLPVLHSGLRRNLPLYAGSHGTHESSLQAKPLLQVSSCMNERPTVPPTSRLLPLL